MIKIRKGLVIDVDIYGVVMAGGIGSRFWPLSRQKLPKQFLNLTGNGQMINEAIERISYITDKENIFIVTNREQVPEAIKATAGNIKQEQILSEPEPRNTAACIGYAAIKIIKKYGDGIMVITPSDHYVKDISGFIKVLNIAVHTAQKSEKLITIGITPTFPSTGFGYIKFDDTTGNEIKRVLEFHEKPDEETAEKYMKSGRYAWNSGMFVWKASTILAKFKEYAPDIYNELIKIGEAIGTDIEKDVIKNVYSGIRNISIDYAIMEPSASMGDVFVIPGEFGWNDVGSWNMMDVLHTPDANGNVLIGDTVAVDVSDTIIYSSGRTVTVVGVNNLVIVETSDVIMVCQKDKAQNVKKIVSILDKENRTGLL